jgi:hypothetical protein
VTDQIERQRREIDGREQRVLRSMSEVLQAAGELGKVPAKVEAGIPASSPADYARPMPPPPEGGQPVHGVQAHKNITIYGEAYATFLERSGDEVFQAALEYKNHCYREAQRAREEYAVEATRAQDFINDIQRRARALDKVAQGKERDEGTE